MNTGGIIQQIRTQPPVFDPNHNLTQEQAHEVLRYFTGEKSIPPKGWTILTSYQFNKIVNRGGIQKYVWLWL